MTKPRAWLSTMAVLAVSAPLFAACSASAPTEATQESNEALSCGWMCQKPVCAQDLGCNVRPATWDEVAPDLSGHGPDMAFVAELQALGCMAPSFYGPNGTGPHYDWPISICPTSNFPAPAEIIPCDSCTGQPPSMFWSVVTWRYQRSSPGACHSAGCAKP